MDAVPVPNTFNCNGNSAKGNENIANAFNHKLQILALN